MAVLNGLDNTQLEEIAAQLGSDVPFTLHGGTMLGTGRGEKLEPLPTSGEYHWVLAVSSEGLSTPTVFATLDELRETNPELPRAGAVDALASALLTGDPEQVAPHDPWPTICRRRPWHCGPVCRIFWHGPRNPGRGAEWYRCPGPGPHLRVFVQGCDTCGAGCS